MVCDNYYNMHILNDYIIDGSASEGSMNTFNIISLLDNESNGNEANPILEDSNDADLPMIPESEDTTLWPREESSEETGDNPLTSGQETSSHGTPPEILL